MNEINDTVPRIRLTALVVLIPSLLLGGCVRYDAPRAMVAAAKEVYGVAIYSARPPYRIGSDSRLRSSAHALEAGTNRIPMHQLQPLANGGYGTWQWVVWATPDVAASWQAWLNSPGARNCPIHTSVTCRRLDWDAALTRLYRAVAYLLGKPPSPLDLRLQLLPRGQGFQARVLHQSRHAVPLEFTFWYPAGAATDSATRQAREQALLYAVTTVGYEFQHVEYAAGISAGPGSPLGPHLLKDEANSSCWRLASQLVILAGRTDVVTIPRVTRQDMALRAAVFGNTVHVQNAALWGPVLLKHDLGEYLARIVVTHAGSSHFRIAATDYPLMNQILTYCRGFTRYGGDSAKGPMPEGAIAHTLFWKNRPKITWEPQ